MIVIGWFEWHLRRRYPLTYALLDSWTHVARAEVSAFGLHELSAKTPECGSAQCEA
jgi:hypothetical protein